MTQTKLNLFCADMATCCRCNRIGLCVATEEHGFLCAECTAPKDVVAMPMPEELRQLALAELEKAKEFLREQTEADLEAIQSIQPSGKWGW